MLQCAQQILILVSLRRTTVLAKLAVTDTDYPSRFELQPPRCSTDTLTSVYDAVKCILSAYGCNKSDDVAGS